MAQRVGAGDFKPALLGAAAQQQPAAGIEAPAADFRKRIAGLAQTLSLREDGLYRMRRTYLGKPGNPFAETGRWQVDASGRLLLRSGAEQSLFEVAGADTLRQLDRAGQPIRTALNYSLRRTAAFDAIDESLRWRGEMIYMADAANFTDCASGLRWPIPMIEGYLALERAYTQGHTAPGAPLLAYFPSSRLQPLKPCTRLPSPSSVMRTSRACPGSIAIGPPAISVSFQ